MARDTPPRTGRTNPPVTPCTAPGCQGRSRTGSLCPGCVARRGTARQRGYTTAYQRVRADYLAEHSTCVLCGAPATITDHHPRSRWALLRYGIKNPDQPQYLRALCAHCHGRQTSIRQPGGWYHDP